MAEDFPGMSKEDPERCLHHHKIPTNIKMIVRMMRTRERSLMICVKLIINYFRVLNLPVTNL